MISLPLSKLKAVAESQGVRASIQPTSGSVKPNKKCLGYRPDTKSWYRSWDALATYPGSHLFLIMRSASSPVSADTFSSRFDSKVNLF